MKRIIFGLALCVMATTVHAGEKKGFWQDLGRSIRDSVVEDVRNQIVQEGVEITTTVKDVPTSPSEAVNRTMTGKAQPNVFLDQAKSFWIQDMRLIMERSVGLDWDALGVDYNTDDELYPLTQDGYVHLRHGHSVRSEFGWAGTPGPVNCDFAYVFYNHFEQQGLPMEVNEACMFEERRIVSQLFKHLKQSLGALGQVPAGVVGNRTDRIVTIGQQGYTQGRGIHPSLDMYSNDRAVNNTGVNMGLISSLYGPMVRERYAQMQGKRFFVSMTAKTTYYDEHAQTLKVLLNIPPHIMATQRTDPNQQNLVYVTGPDFVQDPKAYDRDLQSNLGGKKDFSDPLEESQVEVDHHLDTHLGDVVSK